MKTLKKLTLIIMLVVMSGCTSVQYKKLNTLPVANNNKGLVYFYRDKDIMGFAVSYYIYEGTRARPTKLGALKRGTFFFKHVNPGVHTYWAKTESSDSVTFDVKAGKTYYVKGEIGMGFLAGRPKLSIAHNLEGKSKIPGLKYTQVAK